MPQSKLQLTPLKACRIALNLDSEKLCVKAKISRSYLTRMEKDGAIPSTDIAARLIDAIKGGKCVRDKALRRAVLLSAAQEMYESALGGDIKNLSEMHLLYPERFMKKTKKKDERSWTKNAAPRQ